MTDSTATARELLAIALELPVNLVPAEASMATLEAWDSLAHVRLILAIETRLGRELAPEAAVAIGSVADIAAVLQPTPA